MYSNTRFADAINSVKGLILSAYHKGLAGVSISEHQSLASHRVAQHDIAELKQQYPHMFDHFRVTYGDEIYLVDRDEVETGRKRNKVYHQNHEQGDYQYTGFYHFVLTARNEHGYELLEKVNQKAWQDSFMFGRFRVQRRLPTYEDWLAKEMKAYKGDVIASTACLGSELSHDVRQLVDTRQDYNDPTDKQTAHRTIKIMVKVLKDNGVNADYDKLCADSDKEIDHKKTQAITDAKSQINSFLNYITTVFGKSNVYFELMPSLKKQQKTVNKYLWKLSQKTGIKTIISTDSHYTDFRNEHLHQAFLHAESARRDVYDFYHYAHQFSYNDLTLNNNGFQFFDPKVLQVSAQNSLNLLKTIKPINLDNVKTTADEENVINQNANSAKRINQKVGHKMIGVLENIIADIKQHWCGME